MLPDGGEVSIVGDLGLDFEELGNVLEKREEHDERDVLDGARTVAERVADGLVSMYWTEETIIPKSRSSSISQIEFRECAENKKRGKTHRSAEIATTMNIELERAISFAG